MIPALANHLWQSTLFAAVAGLLTLALRRNRAQMRYWIWLAASLKFLIPFSLLVGIGSQFAWRTAPAVAPPLSSAIGQITESFAPLPMSVMTTPAAPSSSLLFSALMIALWVCGC